MDTTPYNSRGFQGIRCLRGVQWLGIDAAVAYLADDLTGTALESDAFRFHEVGVKVEMGATGLVLCASDKCVLSDFERDVFATAKSRARE